MSNVNLEPFYAIHLIPKMHGGMRKICVPDKRTKRIQRRILGCLEQHVSYLPCVAAYRKGRTILNNAEKHVNHKYLIHYDLVDFFESIRKAQVEDALRKIWVLSGRDEKTSRIISFILHWSLYEDHLPQGGPSSPLLSNLVCRNMDLRLLKLAKKAGATYTRYADDIIISGGQEILKYRTTFKRIIKTEHFRINHKKTGISVLSEEKGHRFHKVTGLLVGANVAIDPEYITAVEQTITDLGRIHAMRNVILGQIAFIHMVEPKTADRLKKMLNAFIEE